MLFDLKSREKFAASYRHLLTAIRLQIVCHICISDINYQVRWLGAMTTIAHIGVGDINIRSVA